MKTEQNSIHLDNNIFLCDVYLRFRYRATLEFNDIALTFVLIFEFIEIKILLLNDIVIHKRTFLRAHKTSKSKTSNSYIENAELK